jgi:polysaccharide pyruvyl transferase WcaK-like protein
MHGVPQGRRLGKVISESQVNDAQRSPSPEATQSATHDGQDIQKAQASESSGSDSISVISKERSPRIALLTPYTGGNFGDASIQDSLIANLRLRLPRAQFSGISLNCDNFLEQHGTLAYPLCNFNSPYYGMARSAGSRSGIERQTAAPASLKSAIRKALSWIPGVRWLGRKLRPRLASAQRETQHWIGGYRFLRKHELLVVSGGGQLDEEWGGPWGHPFTLFKWALLARAARIPFVVASVGVGKITSLKCRLFLSTALRLAKYRSYRDAHSRELSARLLPKTSQDSVVPDLAFSFPVSELASSRDLASLANGRTIVAVSPISYAKPESWPHHDRSFYDQYLDQTAKFIRLLAARKYFVVIVWSSNSDRQVIADLRQLLERTHRLESPAEFFIPVLQSWKELIGVLRSVDILVASRLHSIILGALSRKPTIAISFDPKVDWVMEDLSQTEYLMHIRDFSAAQLAEAVDRIQAHRNDIERELASYQERIQPVLAKQYDSLAGFSIAGLQHSN